MLTALTLLTLALGAGAGPLFAGPMNGSSLEDGKADPANAYGKLPVTFIPNQGQVDKRVRFYEQGAGHGFYFTRKKAVLAFAKGKRGVALHLTPLGASPQVRLEAIDRAPGRVNYLVGSERHTNLPTYGGVVYRDLWPGIDLVFRGGSGKLKYEFHAQPGADPSRIALAYRGADSLSLGAAGDLLIKTPRGILRDSRPQSFQQVNGKRIPVASNYALKGGASGYGFRIGAYDSHRPLVIDPGLLYSTFIGTAGSESAYGIAVDGHGSAYVTGGTSATDFPVTAGAYDMTYGGGSFASDAFVAKLNPAGSALVYSTFLGGGPGGNGSGIDVGKAIAVDASGSAYVTGITNSLDYPTTAGMDQTKAVFGSDAFVTKLNAAGAGLDYSTFLGGSGPFNDYNNSDELGNDIAVDGVGSAYVTGTTNAADFPVTAGAADTTRNGMDAFVTKFQPSGLLDYSTYLGGASSEGGIGIAVRSSRAYVTGFTQSSDFPLTNGTYDGTLGGFHDVFVTKLNVTGSGYDYSTYLGGNTTGEYGEGIAIGDDGSAYVTGRTQSSDFPTTPGAYDSTLGGGTDAFATKLDPAGAALSYSTLFGGTGSDGALGHTGIAVDGAGAAWITGSTDSLDFPTIGGALDTTNDGGGPEAFVTKVAPAGTSLAYSSYLGGNGTDNGWDLALGGGGGKIYVTGSTNVAAFPTTPGAYDTAFGGGGSPPNSDAFVTVFDDDQDDDSLPDEWETQGLTVGGDFIDLPAMGASPTHKDIFVEVDYMQTPGHSHQPSQIAIDKIIQAFTSAPVSNPDSTNGIHLHVDYGSTAPLTWAAGNWGALSKSDNLAEQANLGTGAGTTASPYDWTAFDAIKNANFTTARRAVFHYNVWAHNLSMAMGNTSGISRDISASDFIVSLGGWTSGFGSVDEQAGTFMHELGHNLALGHGGGDGVQWKPNLMSVMSYAFQTRGLIVGGKEGTFDYSSQQLPALNENSLDETTGTGTGSSRGTRYFCGLDNQVIDLDGSAVNWNCDNPPDETDTGVSANVNQGITGNTNSTLDTLNGHNDWANLVYDGGAVGGLGTGSLPQATVADELTKEQDAALPDLTARYPRPKAASPLRVPLVPAYQPCTASNRTHGAPLAYPSCNPPQLQSGQLTVGTSDANGHPPGAVGSAVYSVQVGAAGGIDDSDVKLTFSLTDVRSQGTLADYTGELQATAGARVTDRVNGAATSEPATGTDISFPVTVPCTATPGTADIGATCAVTTSFDAVLPGSIPEGKRAIWGFDQVKVSDGGPDGDVDTGPNTLFAVQGLFVP